MEGSCSRHPLSPPRAHIAGAGRAARAGEGDPQRRRRPLHQQGRGADVAQAHAGQGRDGGRQPAVQSVAGVDRGHADVGRGDARRRSRADHPTRHAARGRGSGRQRRVGGAAVRLAAAPRLDRPRPRRHAGAGGDPDGDHGYHAGAACPARRDRDHEAGRRARSRYPAAAAAPGPHPGTAGSHARAARARRVLPAGGPEARAAHEHHGGIADPRVPPDLGRPAPAGRGRRARGLRRLAGARTERTVKARDLLALALILVTSALPVGAQPKRDDPVQAEQRKLQETQNQLKQEREKAAEARRRETSLLAEIEDTERRLAQKQRDVARLGDRIKRAQAEVAALRGDITRLESYRSEQEEFLARRLRTIYKIHAQGAVLPVILSGESPVQRAATIKHLGSLAALDARMIQEYRVTSDRLADRKEREEARRNELASLRAEAKKEQAEVDREAAKRRQLLAKVRDERAYHERMVGELSEAARRLEAFIQELQARQRRLAKVPPPKGGIEPPGVGFGNLRGRLPWPAEGRIVVPFGAQVHPRFGTRTFRNGVDIEAAEGTDVTTVYAGHVIYTGWFKGYGNLIIVDHGSEYYTLYAHIAEIEVKEGEDVRQGQRIGTVGDTASLAGPRLYFEVRYQGKPQNPVEWLGHRG